MKKIIAFLLMIFTAVSLCACGKQDTKEATVPEETTQKIVNPMVETDEKKISEKTGAEFSLPEKATGISYYMINNEIGQVSFDLDSLNYTLRSKKADAADDFSGLYYTWTQEKNVKVRGNEAEAHIYDGEDNKCGSLIWYDKDSGTALTLSVEGKTTPEKLVKLAESIVK